MHNDAGQRSFKLERNWEGRGKEPTERLFESTGKDVHRFKLDEKHGIIITTHRSGGLRVCDMETDAVLFELTKVCGIHSSNDDTLIIYHRITFEDSRIVNTIVTFWCLTVYIRML